MKRLVAEVDEEDARKLRRFIKKLDVENETAKIYDELLSSHRFGSASVREGLRAYS